MNKTRLSTRKMEIFWNLAKIHYCIVGIHLTCGLNVIISSDLRHQMVAPPCCILCLVASTRQRWCVQMHAGKPLSTTLPFCIQVWHIALSWDESSHLHMNVFKDDLLFPRKGRVWPPAPALQTKYATRFQTFTMYTTTDWWYSTMLWSKKTVAIT